MLQHQSIAGMALASWSAVAGWVALCALRVRESLKLARARLMPPASERHPVRRWFAWAHLMVVAWLAVAQLGALGSWASAWLSPRVGAAPMAQQVRPEPVAVVPVRRLAKPQSGVTPEAQHLAPSKAPRAVSAERPSRPPCVRCAARGS